MEKRRTKTATSRKAEQPKTLGAEAWVAEAWRALSELGVEGVRVEPLAARLGVTKGSFYWHFEDRAALLSALLDDWEQRATAAVIREVDARCESPRERLFALIRMTTASPEAPDAEHAVRAWGAHDTSVRKRLHRVDARREAYVAQLLVAVGVDEARAQMRARALYLALIGEYARVAHGGAATERATWEELMRKLIEP
jgi:AcrR family transcriptional regulator